MTNPARFPRAFPLLLLTLLFALGGCQPGGGLYGTRHRDPLEARAESMVQRQDYRGAAQVYLDEAARRPANEAAGLRLTAAEYLARGNLWAQVRVLEPRVDRALLTDIEKDRLTLLGGQLALADNQPQLCLQRLDEVRAPDLLPDGGLGYYQLRAAAYRLNDEPLKSLEQLVWADGLIGDPRHRDANQTRIWDELSALPDEKLQELHAGAGADTLSGWAELAYQVRANQFSAPSLDAAIATWQRQYPAHPANSRLIEELRGSVPESHRLTGRIALLLPLTGRAATQAAAIRDAFMLAQEQSTMGAYPVLVYDTGLGQPIVSVYDQALAEGADLIVGPLLKEEITELVTSVQLRVPVLALNRIDEPVAIGQPLYQFGLTPEDEAEQAADRAFFDGHQRMIALVPEGDWGERVLAAFEHRWRKDGGQLVAVQRYPAQTADFSRYIKNALNLTQSSDRYRTLVRFVGRNVEFEPRRRQDVDAAFIVAFPREARLIRPQLSFHHAGDLAVYATSHVYNGVPNADRDHDLNGVRFCDTPWTLVDAADWSGLHESIRQKWGSRAAHYERLFALGIDAYRLIPWLDSLQRPGAAEFRGATGLLSMDEHRRLHRRLECAEFQEGEPSNLGVLPDFQPAAVVPEPDTFDRPGASLRWSTVPER